MPSAERDLPGDVNFLFVDAFTQQWMYNFSYLAPIKVTLSILPTYMLQQ